MTVYVNQVAGDDTNPGTQLEPVRTLAAAKALQEVGGLVFVEGGTFPETVQDPVNGRWEGALDANGRHLAHVVGDGVRGRAFYVANDTRTGVEIVNFEMSGQSYAGVQMRGQFGVDTTHLVEGCHIHHTNGTGTNQHGIRWTYGSPTDRRNHIHHIGPANESWGVFAEYTHNWHSEYNFIHNVRKEAIRGFRDKASIRRYNRILLCWIGIADAFSLSPLNYGNLIYQCTYGVNPKHSNSTGNSNLDSYETWGIDPVADPQPWSRWYHNTIWECSDNSVAFMNPTTTADGHVYGVAREVDIRNNIFGGWTGAHIRNHGNGDAGSGIDHALTLIDRNVYSSRAQDTPDAYTYINAFSYFTAANHTDLAGMRALWGWDIHGQRLDPELNDVGPAADFDYADGSVLETLGDDLTLGRQVGARGADATPAKALWTPRTYTAISANVSSKERMFDGRSQTYSTGPATNSEVIGDAGASVAINGVFFDIWSHGSTANPKTYSLEVGNGPAGPWTVAKAGTHRDPYGASIKYDFDPISGRYLRLRVPTNFGDTTKTLLPGLQVGFLEYVDTPIEEPPPPEDPPPDEEPPVDPPPDPPDPFTLQLLPRGRFRTP